MNFPKLNTLWLILPSVVFILLVAAFIVRLSKPSQISTEVKVSPTPISFPQATPVVESGLSLLVQQIQGWQIIEPKLASPAIDRKISLPDE